MYKFFKNIEIADKYLLENRSVPAAILDELKNDVSKNNFIGIAQINPIVGALEYNAKKIVKYINFATEIGLESVIFPELALMGYPIEDTINRHPALVDENI